MLTVLAFRNLVVKKGRSLLLLLGYGLGVGVMIVLLSVGEAMVDQSRDVSLVGGGALTVLPQGIDIEAMRTGGVSGMFFSIGRARFLTRQLLGGARQSRMVRAVSPVIENKLVYLRHGDQVIAARAGGEVPSRAVAVGAGLRVLDGAWRDGASDSAWISPTPEQLYHELDRFHLPPVSDASWAEWHYFNVTTAPGEWWYITYLVGGEMPNGRWGGRLLVSHRNPDGSYRRYTADVPSDSVVLDTARADLVLGASSVRQQDGAYHLTGRARGATGTLGIDLDIHPDQNRYFPPVDLKEGAYLSGYVVPVLSGSASGTLCVAGDCRPVRAAPAYHDHNWGLWRDVTWDWGAARGREFDLLYGAVYTPEDTVFTGRTGAPRIFVALVDSLGVRQILRAREVHYHGARGGAARQGVRAPAGFEFIAAREEDTVQVRARILDFQATATPSAGGRRFLQMRGSFTLEGHVAGVAVADSGTGFFETYIE